MKFKKKNIEQIIHECYYKFRKFLFACIKPATVRLFGINRLFQEKQWHHSLKFENLKTKIINKKQIVFIHIQDFI